MMKCALFAAALLASTAQAATTDYADDNQLVKYSPAAADVYSTNLPEINNTAVAMAHGNHYEHRNHDPLGKNDTRNDGNIVALSEAPVMISAEGLRLKEIFGHAVNQAAQITEETPYDIKWRTKHDNMHIGDERVNLIAEANFGEFVSMLTERVKNMTGVQLFVTVFDGAKVIVVSDTYY